MTSGEVMTPEVLKQPHMLPHPADHPRVQGPSFIQDIGVCHFSLLVTHHLLGTV